MRVLFWTYSEILSRAAGARTLIEAAERAGVSPFRVERALEAFGVKLHELDRTKAQAIAAQARERVLSPRDKHMIAMFNRGISITAIASFYGVSRQRVSQILAAARRIGIPIRSERRPIHLHQVGSCYICHAIVKLQQQQGPIAAVEVAARKRLVYRHWRYLSRIGLVDFPLLRSRRLARALRVYLSGLSIKEIEARYGYRNFGAQLARIRRRYVDQLGGLFHGASKAQGFSRIGRAQASKRARAAMAR